MLFFLNSPLLLLLIRSTLRSARHALALFCQKLNLHGKQLLGQGATSPLGGWARLPQAWVPPSWPESVEKPLGLTLSGCVTWDKALAFYGLVLSRVKRGFGRVHFRALVVRLRDFLGRRGPSHLGACPSSPTVPKAPISPSLSPSGPTWRGEDIRRCQALVCL